MISFFIGNVDINPTNNMPFTPGAKNLNSDNKINFNNNDLGAKTSNISTGEMQYGSNQTQYLTIIQDPYPPLPNSSPEFFESSKNFNTTINGNMSSIIDCIDMHDIDASFTRDINDIKKEELFSPNELFNNNSLKNN